MCYIVSILPVVGLLWSQICFFTNRRHGVKAFGTKQGLCITSSPNQDKSHFEVSKFVEENFTVIQGFSNKAI